MSATPQDAVPATLRWPWFSVVVLVMGLVFNAIVPPFQAPDEFHHFQRAYLLSKGQIVLRSENGRPSGGEVDSALLRYMDSFSSLPGKPDQKLSNGELANAGTVRWSGDATYVTPVGTAYYFPVLYLPQALAISLGRAADFPVGQTYKLARFAALLGCVGLLWLAFRLYQPPIGVLAVLLLPMNLFLFSSAALDGLATATSVLAISSFLRVIGSDERSRTLASCLLLASVAAVVSCRANMLPMLLLPLVAAVVRRDSRLALGSIIIGLFAVGWTLYTMQNTVYPPGPRGVDNSGRLLSFLLDPVGFAKILLNTLGDPELRKVYLYQFIGILGWLDTALPQSVYPFLAVTTLLTVLLTTTLRSFDWPRGAMLVVIVGSVLLTFLALLVQWTVGPATKVEGVQGRYFVIPTLLLVYTLTAAYEPKRTICRQVAIGLACVVAMTSIYFATGRIVARYHTAPAPSDAPASVLGIAPPLSSKQATPLFLASAIAGEPRISEVRIRIGTYRRSNPGRAKLILWTATGERSERSFDLSTLKDNEYARFKVEPNNYVGGRLETIDGGGISVYQATTGPVLVSCLTGVTPEGKVIQATGCP